MSALRVQPDAESFPTPANQTVIRFIHPANNISFLALAANDLSAAGVNGNPPTFGLHLGTALLACQIVAFNKSGFLSTSRDRNTPHLPVLRDHLLLDKRYYFHLDDNIPLYHICLDFSEWVFPHEMLQVPTIWTGGALVKGTPMERLPASAMSGAIKTRDQMCLISLWKDGTTTSPLIPRTEEQWLINNNMEIYANIHDYPLNEDKYNLFTLRADLRLAFDQGAFVFVPKSSQLRIHFLKGVCQSGILFHDTAFDDHNCLARGFMLARFGWAVIKLAKEHIHNLKSFDFSEYEDGNDRNRVDDDCDNRLGGSHQGARSQGPVHKKLKTGQMSTRRSPRNKKKSRTHLEPDIMQDPAQRE